MAKLKLKRPPEKANERTTMHVYLDGGCIAQIVNDQALELDVAPGAHVIWLKADSQGSKKHHFRMKADETKTLFLTTNSHANKLGAFGSGGIIPDLVINGLLLLYYFTIGHNRYLKITEWHGTYR